MANMNRWTVGRMGQGRTTHTVGGAPRPGAYTPAGALTVQNTPPHDPAQVSGNTDRGSDTEGSNPSLSSPVTPCRPSGLEGARGFESLQSAPKVQTPPTGTRVQVQTSPSVRSPDPRENGGVAGQGAREGATSAGPVAGGSRVVPEGFVPFAWVKHPCSAHGVIACEPCWKLWGNNDEPRRRAIDLCACGHTNGVHLGATGAGACDAPIADDAPPLNVSSVGLCRCQAFTPHPQPAADEPVRSREMSWWNPTSDLSSNLCTVCGVALSFTETWSRGARGGFAHPACAATRPAPALCGCDESEALAAALVALRGAQRADRVATLYKLPSGRWHAEVSSGVGQRSWCAASTPSLEDAVAFLARRLAGAL